MSTLEQIANELGEHPSDTKAARAPKATTAKATPTKRGFTLKGIPASLLAQARQWVAAYQAGTTSKAKAYPIVGHSASAPNFYPMIVVAMIPGFSSEADAIAKVRAVQGALGYKPTDRNNLGLRAMSSPSAITREKTMRGLAANWIAKADKQGVLRLAPTRPVERMAVTAIRGQGKRTGDKPAPKGKAKATAKTTSARSNGKVTVSVDKALRSAAKAAERATLRAANRAKQAAQGAQATS